MINANKPVHLIARKGRMILDLVNLDLIDAMNEAADADDFRIIGMDVGKEDELAAQRAVRASQEAHCPVCGDNTEHDEGTGMPVLCRSCTRAKMNNDPELNGMAYEDAPI